MLVTQKKEVIGVKKRVIEKCLTFPNPKWLGNITSIGLYCKISPEYLQKYLNRYFYILYSYYKLYYLLLKNTHNIALYSIYFTSKQLLFLKHTRTTTKIKLFKTKVNSLKQNGLILLNIYSYFVLNCVRSMILSLFLNRFAVLVVSGLFNARTRNSNIGDDYSLTLYFRWTFLAGI